MKSPQLRDNKGFTIVELAIVLAIIGVIFVMAFQSYSRMNNRLDLQSGQLEMETQVKLAMDFLEYDLRLAGNNGDCPTTTADSRCQITDDDGNPTYLFGAFSVFVYNNEGWIDLDESGAIETATDIQINNGGTLGSDAVSIGYSGGHPLTITDVKGNSHVFIYSTDPDGDGVEDYLVQNPISDEGQHGHGPGGDCIIDALTGELILCQNDVYVAQTADCTQCLALQAGNIQLLGGPHYEGLVNHPPGRSEYNEPPPHAAVPYEDFKGGSIQKWINVTYYLNPDADGDSTLDSDGDGNPNVDTPQLIRKFFGGFPEVLAEGIEDMQIVYVVETAGGLVESDDPVADGYSMNDVRNVRLTLVGRTQLTGIDEDKTFSSPVAVEDHTPSSTAEDGFVRLPITTYVHLRNLF
jgi:prepilin-type N-terminal cleavage/methylation domain-containing protein